MSSLFTSILSQIIFLLNIILFIKLIYSSKDSIPNRKIISIISMVLPMMEDMELSIKGKGDDSVGAPREGVAAMAVMGLMEHHHDVNQVGDKVHFFPEKQRGYTRREDVT